MSEKLTVNEFFALFVRTPDLARWTSSADSEEYLTLVTYLVGRTMGLQRSSDPGAKATGT